MRGTSDYLHGVKPSDVNEETQEADYVPDASSSPCVMSPTHDLAAAARSVLHIAIQQAIEEKGLTMDCREPVSNKDGAV